MSSCSAPSREARPPFRKMLFVIVLGAAALLPVRPAFSQDKGNQQSTKPTLESRYEQATRLYHTDRAAGAKQLTELLKDLKTALTRDAGNADLQFLSGEVCFILEKDDEAARYYDAAIALDAKRPKFHFQKGVLLKIKSDPAGAAREFQAVVDVNPKHVYAWFELGEALSTMHDNTRALQAYEKAIAIAPNNADIHSSAGFVLLDLNRREDAIKAFRQATKIEPKNVDAHYNLGQTLQDLGQHAESLAAFRRVCELSPDDYRACAKVVQCYQALGQKEPRDKEHKRMLELFKAGKCGDAQLFCRDQFAAEKNWVQALEYFEMDFSGKDKRPIRYSFVVQESRSGTAKILFRITLGSYGVTTEHGRASGDLDDDERYWHVDRYYPNGTHETFAFFTSEPSYDDVRKMVVEILNGKRKATSSMTPTSQSATSESTP